MPLKIMDEGQGRLNAFKEWKNHAGSLEVI